MDGRNHIIRWQKRHDQPSMSHSQLHLFSTFLNPDFTHFDQDLQPKTSVHWEGLSGDSNVSDSLLTLLAPGEQNLEFSLYCPLFPTPDGIIFVSAEVFSYVKFPLSNLWFWINTRSHLKKQLMKAIFRLSPLCLVWHLVEKAKQNKSMVGFSLLE